MRVRVSDEMATIEERMGAERGTTQREFASVGNKPLSKKDEPVPDPTEDMQPPEQPVAEADLEEATGPYNAREVEQAIREELNTWVGKVDHLMDDDEAQIIIDTVASSHDSTTTQLAHMYNELQWDIPAEDDPEYEAWLEWGTEEAEREFDKIADDLNRKVKLPGNIYFGWEEGYYMFYRWDPEDHPELMEQRTDESAMKRFLDDIADFFSRSSLTQRGVTAETLAMLLNKELDIQASVDDAQGALELLASSGEAQVVGSDRGQPVYAPMVEQLEGSPDMIEEALKAVGQEPVEETTIEERDRYTAKHPLAPFTKYVEGLEIDLDTFAKYIKILNSITEDEFERGEHDGLMDLITRLGGGLQRSKAVYQLEEKRFQAIKDRLRRE